MEKTKGKELKHEVQRIREKPDHQRSFVNILKTQVFALSEGRGNWRVLGRRVACSDFILKGSCYKETGVGQGWKQINHMGVYSFDQAENDQDSSSSRQ